MARESQVVNLHLKTRAVCVLCPSLECLDTALICICFVADEQRLLVEPAARRLRGGLRPAQLEQLIESYGEEARANLKLANRK